MQLFKYKIFQKLQKVKQVTAYYNFQRGACTYESEKGKTKLLWGCYCHKDWAVEPNKPGIM